MNLQKFTQKSIEAVQDAKSLAQEHGNQQMEQEHLLLALVRQEGGLVRQLLDKMGVSAAEVEQKAQEAVERFPHVSGGGDQVYLSRALDEAVTAAEKCAVPHPPGTSCISARTARR